LSPLSFTIALVAGQALQDAGSDESTARSQAVKIFEILRALKLVDLKDDREEEVEEKVIEEEEGVPTGSGTGELDEGEDTIVGEGECELCEREMPLTKHHLIPREVHEWYKKHEGMTRELLHTGVMLCRPCHSCVHKFEDNKTLARDFNTLAKLKAHEKMPKWINYIRKQRPRSRADKRTLKPNGPRDLPPTFDY